MIGGGPTASAARAARRLYHPPGMRRTGPILILVLGALALFVDFWPNLNLPEISAEGGSRRIETKLGLDLQGGLKVEYRVDPSGGKAPTTADVNVVKGIIERRVNATGVAEPVVVTSGTDRRRW